MKVLRILAITMTLILSSMPSSANVNVIAQGISCGEWVKARHEKGLETVIKTNWLWGFLSGMSVGRGNDVLKISEVESYYLWMDNYCIANPLEDIADGAIALHVELVKKRNK